jgi:hypothetical protein
MLASIRHLDQLVKQGGVRLVAERSLMVDWTDIRVSAPQAELPGEGCLRRTIAAIRCKSSQSQPRSAIREATY